MCQDVVVTTTTILLALILTSVNSWGAVIWDEDETFVNIVIIWFYDQYLLFF